MTTQTMVRMLKVTADTGDVSVVEVPQEGGLPTLQDHVGGLIDVTNLSDEVAMLVNDEALLVDAPVVNALASMLYGFYLHRQPICGDVLLFANDPSGEHDYADDPDLGKHVLALLSARLKEAMLQ